MLKLIITTFCLYICSITVLGQTEYDKSWEDLLNNERPEALKTIKKVCKKDPSIEAFLSREIIRENNGFFNREDYFVDEFIKYKDFDKYLYALWNEKFLFANYLAMGINKDISQIIDKLNAVEIQNPTVRKGLIYLKGISARHNNNFDEYKKYMKDLSSIDSWQFCGVFENLNNSGLDAIYEPETIARSSKDFNANSNGYLNWYQVGPQNEGYSFFVNHNEYGSGVHYAQTFINNPVDRNCVFRIGASSKFKVWLNDVLIYENSQDRDTDLDVYLVQLKLPAGTNRLLIKQSEPNYNGNFIVRITDDKGNDINDIEYSDIYSEYVASGKESLEVKILESEFEQFFINKIKENPDNILYQYCLIATFLRNQKHQEAKKILDPLIEKYPNSSFLRRIQISIYTLAEDNSAVNEAVKNMQLEDELYYLSLTYKFGNINDLFKMDMNEMNEFLDNYAESTDSELIKISTRLIKWLRLDNKDKLKEDIDKIVELSLEKEDVRLLKIYAPLYGSFLSDEERSIELLEELNKRFFDYEVRRKLERYYSKRNQKDKVIKLLEEDAALLSFQISPLQSLIERLHEYKRFKESLVYIDKMLELYPYSFKAMELKGDALLQMKNNKEAVVWYKKSLIHNSSNMSIRSKIRDIQDESDLLTKYKMKDEDVYKFISKHRSKITVNSYGYNLLLDEAIVELYEEASGKSRYTLAYEITSDKGIESLKEYNLNIGGRYTINKSEIVKPNGSVSPADRNRSNLVFTGLEIGDVIYIDYETSFNGFGRFYQDYTSSYRFEGWYPSVKVSYSIIVPENYDLQYFVQNGELDFTLKKDAKHKLYKWEQNNSEGMLAYEDFMPETDDVVKVLHVSTISNWGEIAKWYSDLVRPQIEIDDEVKTTFKKIFGDEDVTALTEEERARRIYYFIMNNCTYSSVSFRQSGFIPQKPSKTILTKLGDCKDFSALFVALAKMAKLKANMVLVLTSNYGVNGIVLPCQDFNHCIVRVEIDGKEQYLELTDKSLPFKSLPTTLRNAAALNIPFASSSNVSENLIHLEDVLRMPNVYKNSADIHIGSHEHKVKVLSTSYGAIRSYFADDLSDPNYDMIVEAIDDQLSGVLGDKVDVDSVYNIVNKKELDSLQYEVDFTLFEKLNKVGSFNIFKIPYLANAYNANIISEKERNFPINYVSFENIDVYILEYNFFIDSGLKFIEYPEDIELSYKGHKYQRKFVKVDDNHLKLMIRAETSDKDISVEEYKEFRAFVMEVIEAKEELLAFK